MMRGTLEERFRAKFIEGHPGECWPWNGARQPDGYGTIERGSRGEGKALAHRLAWNLAHGSIPRGAQVLHRCDNPCCVNPAHLFLGSQKDNMDDMLAKGRKAIRKGDSHPMSRLTAATVRWIRAHYQAGSRGSYGARALAQRFGVTRVTIRDAARGKYWSHLVGPGAEVT